jgi:hypothetical protein
MYSSDELPPLDVEQAYLNVFKEEHWSNCILSSASDRTSPITGMEEGEGGREGEGEGRLRKEGKEEWAYLNVFKEERWPNCILSSASDRTSPITGMEEGEGRERVRRGGRRKGKSEEGKEEQAYLNVFNTGMEEGEGEGRVRRRGKGGRG